MVLMISVSTSWNADVCESGKTIVAQILKAGVKNIELGFSIDESKLEEIVESKKNNLIRVSSVHNYCPVLPGYKPGSFTPDIFSLSSPDDSQREKAIFLTKRSIDTSKIVGAEYLVLHAGRVEMEQKTKELIWLYNSGQKDSNEYKALFESIQLQRQSEKGPYIEAVTKSLKTVLDYARLKGIKVCIENRFYYREIPTFEEIGLFFEIFKDFENLKFWYDVGHAQVGENLGFTENIKFLKAYGDKIAGMHLHDVKGTHDHLVPSFGDFDFSLLKPYIKKHTIKVLEIHQPATAEQIKTGISYLLEIGLFKQQERDLR
jgi:sugar phosphate isomerase/epimerase